MITGFVWFMFDCFLFCVLILYYFVSFIDNWVCSTLCHFFILYFVSRCFFSYFLTFRCFLEFLFSFVTGFALFFFCCFHCFCFWVLFDFVFFSDLIFLIFRENLLHFSFSIARVCLARLCFLSLFYLIIFRRRIFLLVDACSWFSFCTLSLLMWRLAPLIVVWLFVSTYFLVCYCAPKFFGRYAGFRILSVFSPIGRLRFSLIFYFIDFISLHWIVFLRYYFLFCLHFVW